jgi:hypothetical protein
LRDVENAPPKKKNIAFETTRVTQKNIMGIKSINVLVSENEILYALSHISLIGPFYFALHFHHFALSIWVQ